MGQPVPCRSGVRLLLRPATRPREPSGDRVRVASARQNRPELSDPGRVVRSYVERPPTRGACDADRRGRPMPHPPDKIHRMFELVEPIATVTFSEVPNEA